MKSGARYRAKARWRVRKPCSKNDSLMKEKLMPVERARRRSRKLRAEDAQRLAAKYFTLENTSAHEYEPLTSAPRTFDAESFAKTVVIWSPGFAQTGDAIKPRAADTTSAMAIAAQGQERPPAQQAAMESLLPL